MDKRHSRMKTRGSRGPLLPAMRWAAMGVALSCAVASWGQVPGDRDGDGTAECCEAGDVLCSIGNSQIEQRDPATGLLIRTINTTSGSAEETGMCFDGTGNLFTTNFESNNMTKVDMTSSPSGNQCGTVITHPFAGPFNQDPESCVFSNSGDFLVGEADGLRRIQRFTPVGGFVASWNPVPDARGLDWIDLAADQCTVYYASEGNLVKRFDICTNTQLPDFASGLSGPCFALRILPAPRAGEVLVACSNQVYRLDTSGNISLTFPRTNCPGANSFLFAMNIAPDNQHFWTADYGGGQVCEFDMDVVGPATRTVQCGVQVTTAGLAICGELHVATTSTTNTTGTTSTTTSTTTTTTTTTIATTTTTTLPDHQQCYELKPSAYTPHTVTAQDQFGTLTLTTRYPHRLCAAANKNGSGIHNPTEHLTGYPVKPARFVRQLDQTVVDQFGTLHLDVIGPKFFMVPTGKDGVPIAPPTGDHFTCYKVRPSHGATKFTKRTATISDQFESVTETLLTPYLLCAPANKNNEDPTAPSHPGHLLCYKERFSPFGTLQHTIDNQFETARAVTLIARRELCVAALKNPGSTTTTTTTTNTTTTTTSTTTTTTTTSTTTTTTSTTTTTTTTPTTLYGSPSRAFLSRVESLLD
jgi:hypothetical protein